MNDIKEIPINPFGMIGLRVQEAIDYLKIMDIKEGFIIHNGVKLFINKNSYVGDICKIYDLRRTIDDECLINKDNYRNL